MVSIPQTVELKSLYSQLHKYGIIESPNPLGPCSSQGKNASYINGYCGVEMPNHSKCLVLGNIQLRITLINIWKKVDILNKDVMETSKCF